MCLCFHIMPKKSLYIFVTGGICALLLPKKVVSLKTFLVSKGSVSPFCRHSQDKHPFVTRNCKSNHFLVVCLFWRYFREAKYCLSFCRQLSTKLERPLFFSFLTREANALLVFFFWRINHSGSSRHRRMCVCQKNAGFKLTNYLFY